MNSLRAKIYLGFAVILVLLVVIGLIGYSGAQRLDESSDAMKRISDVNAVVLQIDRDVQELQLRISRYMGSGHDSLRAEIIAMNDRLIRLISVQAANQTDPELRGLFQNMSEHLPEYGEHFDAVIEERRIRADLVQSLLPQQSGVIFERLAELNRRVRECESTDEIKVAVLKCETSFSQAEKLLLRYYVSPNTKFVNQAQRHINDAVHVLSVMANHKELSKPAQKLILQLVEYERIGIRAVQATRSYLFLVNVVMAGAASEVSYYSDRLRRLSELRRDAISADSAATAATVRKMTGLGIGISVALASLIAGRLAVLILKPIGRLTSTFKRLASGESLITVPETNRRDEIGQMAMAAEVFNEQNRRQQELLEESEKLASELAAKADELAATNADLDSFAYVASHDLKSPLRAIRQLATWIDEDSGYLLPKESLRHFCTLKSRVQRMELLLDDLLDFSRVGRNLAGPEVVDVDKVLNEIVQLTDNPRGVVIRWKESMPTFRTIRVPFEQVLLNLIGNAIKHNDKGSEGLIEIHCQASESGYRFSVSDNGPGIDVQHHLRVFQMYQRVGDPTVEGSGMGLAIVKKQVERIGGKISLTSECNRGATFEFTWPSVSA